MNNLRSMEQYLAQGDPCRTADGGDERQMEVSLCFLQGIEESAAIWENGGDVDRREGSVAAEDTCLTLKLVGLGAKAGPFISRLRPESWVWGPSWELGPPWRATALPGAHSCAYRAVVGPGDHAGVVWCFRAPGLGLASLGTEGGSRVLACSPECAGGGGLVCWLEVL
ncbi:unnamed protein product, partial [Gadus morhua 'NCC']